MFQARDAEAIIIILIKRERLHFHSYHSADFYSRCLILPVLSDGLVEGEREASSAAGGEARRFPCCCGRSRIHGARTGCVRKACTWFSSPPGQLAEEATDLKQEWSLIVC
ncbi:hypothetical protein MHYP_G00053830 [Metynnis hypsauchen]